MVNLIYSNKGLKFFSRGTTKVTRPKNEAVGVSLFLEFKG